MLKNVIYCTLCCIIFFSCSDVLDPEVYSELSDSNFFKTENDIEVASIGVYEVLSSHNGIYDKDMINFDILASDAAWTTRNPEKPLNEYTYNYVTNYVEDIWKGNYQLINRANLFVQKVEAMDNVGEEVKNRYLGEVKFLRALGYFNLVRHYNRIPLRKKATTTVDDLDAALAEPEEVYNFIIEDLTFAIDNLPPILEGDDLGRADQGAAKALLSKVYLTMGGYPLHQTDKFVLARDIAKDLIDNKDIYGYGLWNYYGDEFETENDNGKEDIFNIQFDSNIGIAPNFEGWSIHKAVFKGERRNGIKYDGLYRIRPSQYFINSFGPDDARAIQVTGNYSIGGEQYSFRGNNKVFGKWVDQDILDGNLNAQTSSQDYKLLRFAEIYLIAAEAENEVNGPTADAYEWINTIRARARVGKDGMVVPGAVPDLSGLDQESFREAILHERLLELGGEFKRWFDLVRTETLNEQIVLAQSQQDRPHEFPNLPPSDWFLPIPFLEIQNNGAIE